MPEYKQDLNLQCDHQVLCFSIFDEPYFYIRKQLLLVLMTVATLEKTKHKDVCRSGVTGPGKCTFSTALCLLEERTGMFRVSGLIFVNNSLYKKTFKTPATESSTLLQIRNAKPGQLRVIQSEDTEPAGTWTHTTLLYPVCCIPLITNIYLKSASQKCGQDLISHAWALITWDEASSHIFACLPGSKHLEEALNEALKRRPLGFLPQALYGLLGHIARVSHRLWGFIVHVSHRPSGQRKCVLTVSCCS